MKPKMTLKFKNKIGDGYALINKAGSILSSNGLKDKSKEIHFEAKSYDYEFNMCLMLLKKYMDI